MPGSFQPDNDPRLHCARFKSSVYLPPVDTSRSSSATSETTHTPSTSKLSRQIDFASQQSRKRPRLDSQGDESRQSRHKSLTTSWFSEQDVLSPAPLVSTDYRIAGGLDTTTALKAQREEDAHEFDYEEDCRPNRYTQPSSHQSEAYFPQTPAPGSKRRLSRSPPGWSKTVWALTGGLAGKVINFCWNNTFKGFYAGGGDGYQLDIGSPDVTSSAWTEVDSKEDVFHDDYNARSRREQTPVPGGFPEDLEYVEEYMSQLYDAERNDSTPTIASTSDQVPSSALRSSWVVVDAPNNTSRDPSPVRKKSRASTANLYARAPVRQATNPCRPRIVSRSTTGRSNASYASPRPSITPNTFSQPRHSSSSFPINSQNIDTPTLHSPKRPGSNVGIRPSLGSPRRQVSTASPQAKASPEVRKFEQKMRRKEAKQDESMNRFNLQLQAMIREGQQALGSKIEVDLLGDADVDVDEGYEEGNGGGEGGWEREYVRPDVWS